MTKREDSIVKRIFKNKLGVFLVAFFAFGENLTYCSSTISWLNDTVNGGLNY